MAKTGHPVRTGDADAPDDSVVTVGLIAFGVIELALGLFQFVAPHAFFRAIGPFGVYNAHYSRDFATVELAIGLALLIAVRQRDWRVGVLAVATIQFALHALNHLIDIGGAHPEWVGFFDFFSLAIGAAGLAWLFMLAREMAAGPSSALSPR